MKKTVYFRKESIILYPTVEYQNVKGNIYKISKVEYADILNYVDKGGFCYM